MSLIKKAWGFKEHLYDDGTTSVDLLSIQPNGYCSKHFHKLLSNKFHVLDGTLRVIIFQRDSPEKIQDTFILGPAMRELAIPPGNIHQFTNIGPEICHVIETAYILGWHEESDITRLSEGGVA